MRRYQSLILRLGATLVFSLIASGCSFPVGRQSAAPVPASPTAPAATPTQQLLADQPTPGATQTHTSTPPEASKTVPVETPAMPTPLPSPTAPAAQAGLSNDGPWAVFALDGALAVSNPDGSGWTTIPIPVSGGDPNLTPAPGGWVAFLSGSDDNIADLSLNLLHLPDGETKLITPLLSTTLRQAFEQDAQYSIDLIQALTSPDNQRWSPDGRYLAFAAALDGPSSDLYVYEMESGDIRRLTSGPGQTASLLWSPDSRWIVHSAVETFGSGAGWSMQAVWAASVDGKTIKKLYDTDPDSGGEIFNSWYDADQFMVYTWSPVAARNVRLVNVRNGRITSIYAGEIGDAALNPITGQVAIRIDEYLASLGSALEGPGIYMINRVGDRPQLALAGEWYYLSWEPNTQQFLINTGGVSALLSGNGALTRFEERANLIFAPDGEWLAACDLGYFGSLPGLAVYRVDGELLWEDAAVGCQEIVWRPDSSGFFAWLDPELVSLTLPDAGTTIIQEDFSGQYLRAATWVYP